MALRAHNLDTRLGSGSRTEEMRLTMDTTAASEAARAGVALRAQSAATGALGREKGAVHLGLPFIKPTPSAPKKMQF